MTIKAVFRVQCDGPCRGWLSINTGHRLEVNAYRDHLVVSPKDDRAAWWTGERAARLAAQNAGWVRANYVGINPVKLMCPTCAANPLGIQLPPPPVPDKTDECCHESFGSCRHQGNES